MPLTMYDLSLWYWYKVNWASHSFYHRYDSTSLGTEPCGHALVYTQKHWSHVKILEPRKKYPRHVLCNVPSLLPSSAVHNSTNNSSISTYLPDGVSVLWPAFEVPREGTLLCKPPLLVVFCPPCVHES